MENARQKLRILRDQFKKHDDPEVKKIGRLLDLFIISSYETKEIGNLCDVFDAYLNSLLGGDN